MAAPLLLAKNPQTELALLPALAQSAARAIGSQAGREILRGVLGSILGKRR